MNLYFCAIVRTSKTVNIVARNTIGLAALLMAYYIPDRMILETRLGFDKISPYLFLALMYGWIIFHNTFLFRRLYLSGKKHAYFLWTGLLLLISSLNMHFVLIYGFDHANTLPHILMFWIFTLTGLGIYVMYSYLPMIQNKEPINTELIRATLKDSFLSCMIEGTEKQIALIDIVYLESLENYAKVITAQKTHIVRLSLKEAESKLPKPAFLRISRSHIVNTSRIEVIDQTHININGQRFKIGKVYKRYVEEQLALVNSIEG
jgi:hypothetical protein